MTPEDQGRALLDALDVRELLARREALAEKLASMPEEQKDRGVEAVWRIQRRIDDAVSDATLVLPSLHVAFLVERAVVDFMEALSTGFRTEDEARLEDALEHLAVYVARTTRLLHRALREYPVAHLYYLVLEARKKAAALRQPLVAADAALQVALAVSEAMGAIAAAAVGSSALGPAAGLGQILDDYAMHRLV